MKKTTINKLFIQNFKGIPELIIEMNGQSTTVSGTNGIGKTTIADAWQFLLVDTDSAGKSVFQIKPTTQDGEEIHQLETIVQADLDVAGEFVSLKKMFYEVWQKKRGTAQAQFSGNHTTDFYINGSKISKKEYLAAISSMFGNSEAMKSLTDPFYFCESMKWEDRRKTLVSLAGDIENDIVFDRAFSNISCDEIKDKLAKTPSDQLKKDALNAQKSLLKRLAEIPALIKELTSQIQAATPVDSSILQTLQDELRALTEERTQFDNSNILSTLQNELKAVTLEIEAAESKAEREWWNTKLSPLSKQIQELIPLIQNTEREIDRLKRDNEEIERLKTQQSSKRASLLKKWHEVNDEQIEADVFCPTCGQEIPEHRRAEAQEAFNLSKAERLVSISTDGKSAKAEIEKLEAEKIKIIAGIENSQKKLAELAGKKKDLDAEYEKLSSEAPEPEGIEPLRSKNEEILNQIEAVKTTDKNPKLEEIECNMSEINSKIQEQNMLAAKSKAAEGQKSRITELEKEEKSLNAEFERLAHELFLIEQFTIAKIQLLEDKINEKFGTVKFKMFHSQGNGEVVECCEALVNGVSFVKGLNNAACINAGLEVVNVLSKHNGVSLPIFIDNSESVVEIIPTEAQIIRLEVNPKFEQLTITHDSENRVAA